MKRGQAYLERGDLAKANVEFRNAIQISPKDSSARLLAGEVAERLGRPRDALGLYQSVVDADPENAKARASLGRLMVFGGAPQQGLKVIEPALAKHPDDATLLVVRAAARARLGDTTGAVADADHALQMNPNSEDGVAVRAGLYKQSGDVAGATRLVSDAVSRLPNSLSLRVLLVDLYESAGDVARSEEQRRALIGLMPEEAQFRYQLAAFYTRNNRLDDAQRILEEAAQALPDRSDVKIALVDFLATHRDAAEGERLLRDYIAKTPGDYDLRLNLGALLQHTGNVDAAVAAYDEIVQRDPTGPGGLQARDRLAAIAFARNDSVNGAKLLAEVLEKSPHDAAALALRGRMELGQNDPAAAIADLRALLRDQPRALDARRLLAQAYLANGEPVLAEEALHDALEQSPRDAGVRIELARVLVKAGRTDEAIKLLEDAAKETPSDVTSRQELVGAYLVKGDFAAARATTIEVQRLQPKSPLGFYLAGLVAQAQKQPEEARAQLDRALALEPKNFTVLAALATVDMRSGHADRALSLVKGAIDQDPSNAAAINLLGELYLAQKSLPLAQGTFERAISVAPKWWVPYRNLALVKYSAGDVDGATAAYDSGLKAVPTAAQLVDELVAIYERSGRVDDAIARYEALYRQDAHSQFVANNLAMLLVTHKTDRASLDRARDLTAAFGASGDGRLLDTGGWVFYKRAEYTLALPMLERAAERAPKSPEVRYHLGMAEFKSGKTDRARSDLEAALAAAPEFPGAGEARSTLAALHQQTATGGRS